jgi:hypothetical protein
VAVGAWWWERLKAKAFPDGAEALMAEHELLTPGEVAVMFRVNP